MNRATRIFVAGHRGLVGSAMVRCLKHNGFNQLILRHRSELDLTDQMATQKFFRDEKPEVVILAAAKVGGINANNSLPAEFVYENLAIQTNVIHEAYRSGVRKLLFLGSSCVYPRESIQPITEDSLLSGPLEPTNRSYALAKIAGIEMCWAYNRQYGTRYLTVMPTNLYGPGDNYDLQTAHVLPALIRKIHEAKSNQQSTFVAWGTGEVLREFLYSDDMADASLFLLTTADERLVTLYSHDHPPLINIGSGRELRISELIEKIVKVVQYTGNVSWDLTYPDGTPRKLIDSSKLYGLGWRPSVDLPEGIQRAYNDFRSRCVRP